MQMYTLLHTIFVILICRCTVTPIYADSGHYIEANCFAYTEFESWLSQSPPADEYELIQAQAYIRHGARSIAYDRLCWTEPNSELSCPQTIIVQPSNEGQSLPTNFQFQLKIANDSNLFPGDCMVGQLLELGYKMEYNNGAGLRQRYVDTYQLLPPSFESGTAIDQIIVIRADAEQRTQHSAMALFTGLYDIPDLKDGYYEMSIEYQDMTYETMFPNAAVCPQMGINERDAMNSAEYQNQYTKVTAPLVEQLNGIMYGGAENDTLFSYDCATSYLCQGYPIPTDYTQEMYDAITDDSTWYRKYLNTYPNWSNGTRFRTGPLLKTTFDRFQSTVNSLSTHQEESVKLYVYSGHDEGPIMPFLSAFQYNYPKWSPYASLITLELWRKGSELFIGANYNGKVIALPAPCDSGQNKYLLCSWHLFQQYMAPVLPTMDDCPFM